MDYQQVKFSCEAGPTFTVVPPLPSKTSTGAQPLEAVKKPKVVLNAKRSIPREAQPPQQVRNEPTSNTGVSNKRGRKPDTSDNPFSEVSAFLISSSSNSRQARLTKRQEASANNLAYEPDDSDVEMEQLEDQEDDDDDDDDDNLRVTRSANVAAAEPHVANPPPLLTTVFTQFGSIVPEPDGVNSSAIMLEDSENQQNTYHFLRALEDKTLSFSDPVSVSASWSGVLSADDNVNSWFYGFLTAPDSAASNISVVVSGCKLFPLSLPSVPCADLG